jgi:hypothetical protein
MLVLIVMWLLGCTTTYELYAVTCYEYIKAAPFEHASFLHCNSIIIIRIHIIRCSQLMEEPSVNNFWKSNV